MSVASNVGDIRWAKQSAQGTAATAASTDFAMPLHGGSRPKASITEATLSETTANQMMTGRYRGGVSVAGDPQFYVRPKMIGSLFYGCLGAVAESGSADPWTHTITPANSLPWWTFWTNTANLIWERAVDCKIVGLTLHGSWGNPLEVTANVMGLRPQGETAAQTTATVELGNEFMHSNGSGALLIEGTAVASIDDFTLTIQRNGQVIGGDSFYAQDISEGVFDVTLAIRKLLLTAAFYNLTHYGTSSLTSDIDIVTTVRALAGSPAGAQFTFTNVAASPGPERSLKIALPTLVAQPYGIDPAPNTDPQRESITLQAVSTGATPITVTVKNGRSTVA